MDDISIVANPSSNTAQIGGEIANLNVNGNISLSANTFISGDLTLTSGKVTLGAKNLTILGTISGASSSNYIQADGTGVLKQGIENGSSKTFPVGTSNYYVPITIAQNGTSDSISLRAEEQVLADGTSGTTQTSDALDVSWIITEKVSGGSRVNLTVEWPSAAELSSFDPTACFFSHYRDGSWYPGSAVDVSGSDPRTITLSEVTSFSPFSVGSGSSPLPVALSFFRANKRNNEVELKWQTLSEKSVDHFVVERNSKEVAKVLAIGESNFVNDYCAIDLESTFEKNLTYALFEIDKNGKKHQLAKTQIFKQLQAIQLIKDKNRLIIMNPGFEDFNYRLSDISGRIIKEGKLSLDQNDFYLQMNSIYIITLFNEFYLENRIINFL